MDTVHRQISYLHSAVIDRQVDGGITHIYAYSPRQDLQESLDQCPVLQLVHQHVRQFEQARRPSNSFRRNQEHMTLSIR